MSASLLDRVEILRGRRFADERGWLHVALGASHLPPGMPFGEVYAVHSDAAGQRRGDHFHPSSDEWFAVVQGSAVLLLEDPADGRQRQIRLEAEQALTVRVPAGLAHCLVCAGPGPLTVLAWASREHDPADVRSYRVGHGEPV